MTDKMFEIRKKAEGLAGKLGIDLSGASKTVEQGPPKETYIGLTAQFSRIGQHITETAQFSQIGKYIAETAQFSQVGAYLGNAYPPPAH